ncbi:MAG: hypothetical protein RL173_79 [Fibrobacterota bacterium]|jgi:hypothetical protein
MDMKRLVKKVLARWGLEIRTTRMARLQAVFEAALAEWARRDFRQELTGPFSVTGIVFSRDRAMQLHALLESWFANARGAARMVVLWTVSDHEHEASYRELAAHWGDKVEWVRETDFRADLSRLVESDASSHLFFLTDDGIVLRPFDLSDALLPDPGRRVFSLCHAPDLDWCFILGKSQRVPPLRRFGQNLLAWNWTEGETGTDWNFPLSVDGKFFSRQEMSLLVRDLPFRNPNTFEQALQVFQPLFAGREGVCFSQAALVNVPCNAVQTQFDNPVTGAHSTTELNARWREGKRIAWEDFQNLSPREAEVRNFRFVERE